MRNTKYITFQKFLSHHLKGSNHAPFKKLMHGIIGAARSVNSAVSQIGLTHLSGFTGKVNVHGEQTQQLDEYANQKFIQFLMNSGQCSLIASEENDDIIQVEGAKSAPYVVMLDPLDGSSNIDVNVSVGTIFSIYKKVTGTSDIENCLQKGDLQVAAGYVIYGPATMLVVTIGKGVYGFTLNPRNTKFYLTHPNMTMPMDGHIYSINEGNYTRFEEGIKQYIKYCQREKEENGNPYTSRYIGSMVADIHRNLLKGGVFIYPATKTNPNGKLRLNYECNPMAMIIEQAGGLASDGNKRILSVEPTEVHQRVPIIAGSLKMVKTVEEFLMRYASQKRVA